MGQIKCGGVIRDHHVNWIAGFKILPWGYEVHLKSWSGQVLKDLDLNGTYILFKKIFLD